MDAAMVTADSDSTGILGRSFKYTHGPCCDTTVSESFLSIFSPVQGKHFESAIHISAPAMVIRKL